MPSSFVKKVGEQAGCVIALVLSADTNEPINLRAFPTRKITLACEQHECRPDVPSDLASSNIVLATLVPKQWALLVEGPP